MCIHCLDNHLVSLSNSKVLPHNNRIVIRLGLDIGNDERGGLLKRMNCHIVTLQNVPIVTARETLKSTILLIQLTQNHHILNATSTHMRLPPEFKHINKGRKRN